MACQGTPTLTQFSSQVSTYQTVTESQSLSTITGTPTTQTLTSSSCVQSASDGSCASFSTTFVTTTIAGVPTITSVNVPVTVTLTTTNLIPTQTLYAPCGSTSDSVISHTTTPAPTTTTTPTPTPSSTHDDHSSSVSLGTPTVFTTIIVVTAPNGVTTTSESMVTTTPTLSPMGGGSGHKTSMGPIIGGVVGGLIGLGLLAGAFWLWWRKRHSRWDDIFDDDDHSPTVRRNMNLLENEPKPYQYGVVGATPPPPGPPSETPSLAFLHNRSPSSAPLLNQEASPSSFRTSQHTLESSYNQHAYPPQSPPFLAAPTFGNMQQAGYANMQQGQYGNMQPGQRPGSMGSQIPSQESSFSRASGMGMAVTPESSSPSSVGRTHARAASAGWPNEQGQMADGSFAVQQRQRPQSAVAASSNPQVLLPLPTQMENRAEKPPPTYDVAMNSPPLSPHSNRQQSMTSDDLDRMGLSGGVRLALANPDLLDNRASQDSRR